MDNDNRCVIREHDIYTLKDPEMKMPSRQAAGFQRGKNHTSSFILRIMGSSVMGLPLGYMTFRRKNFERHTTT